MTRIREEEEAKPKNVWHLMTQCCWCDSVTGISKLPAHTHTHMHTQTDRETESINTINGHGPSFSNRPRPMYNCQHCWHGSSASCSLVLVWPSDWSLATSTWSSYMTNHSQTDTVQRQDHWSNDTYGLPLNSLPSVEPRKTNFKLEVTVKQCDNDTDRLLELVTNCDTGLC